VISVSSYTALSRFLIGKEKEVSLMTESKPFCVTSAQLVRMWNSRRSSTFSIHGSDRENLKALFGNIPDSFKAIMSSDLAGGIVSDVEITSPYSPEPADASGYCCIWCLREPIVHSTKRN
jgi:hypothetical protein